MSNCILRLSLLFAQSPIDTEQISNGNYSVINI